MARAQAAPGVHAVITGAEFPHRSGWIVKDQTLLARDVVRYVGEPVAVVLSEDPTSGEDAAELVVVDYDPLPALIGLEEARDGAPIYPDAGSNVNN